MPSYLLILSEAAALAWVLTEERMAFSASRKSAARRLQVGDELLLYTTRGCFHNPPRDMSRVMGLANVMSEAAELPKPVTFGDRVFTYGCGLEVLGVAPFRQGVALAPLVPRLEIFPDPHAWSAWLRRPLVPLPSGDIRLLRRELLPLLEPVNQHVAEYIEAGRRWPPAAHRHKAVPSRR